ncbi:hypothetical protein THL1_2049 [Pseudomonas sp. TCU-HL1]|nr:hypothetical protein THL1_2049 [Pseudomonas sp. TCU-HL1]
MGNAAPTSQEQHTLAVAQVYQDALAKNAVPAEAGHSRGVALRVLSVVEPSGTRNRIKSLVGKLNRLW